jgi:hypothetical protein
MLGPDGLAGGILAAQQKPIDAIAELNRVMDESLSAAEQIAYLTGEDALTSLNEGLNSPLLVDRLTAKDALAKVVEQLQTLGPAGYAAAVALLNQLGYGFNDPVALGTATQMARRAAGVVRGVFPFSEPKDPLSPFRGITNWGGNIVKMIAEGMDGQLGTASASARALAGALVPSLPDMAISGMANSSGVGVPMMGQNIQYVLSVEGLPVVIGSAEDVMERWKQMTSLSRDGVQ